MAVPRGSLRVRAQLGLPPLLLLTVALAGGSGTASAEAFDSVLGDTASCHRACQLTYPLHTYPKVGPVRTGLQPFPGRSAFRPPAPLSALGTWPLNPPFNRCLPPVSLLFSSLTLLASAPAIIAGSLCCTHPGGGRGYEDERASLRGSSAL